jgi:hypothetical protein
LVPSNPASAPSAAKPYAPLVLNSSGKVAFMATDPSTGGAGYTIQAGRVDNLQVVASRGLPISSAPPGTKIDFFMYPTINAVGQVAIYCSTYTDTPGNVTGANVYVGTPGDLHAAIQDVVPGLQGLLIAPNSDFDVYETPALSSTGQVAIYGQLWNGNTYGGQVLVAGPPGNVHVVARTGQHAANAPANVSIDAEQLSNVRLGINGKGQVAFLTSRYFGSKPALYAADSDGSLLLVAGVDLPFELSPGDTRTVADIFFNPNEFTGGEDGRPFAFNDAGQLAFGLTFTDDTSAVILATVPEPGSIALGVIAAGLFFSMRPTRSI